MLRRSNLEKNQFEFAELENFELKSNNQNNKSIIFGEYEDEINY